ncbi:MAG: hypothetical protein GY703_20905, partial [Gammaproteobacteria bacterium]|nr:hypothetical protein [Gammaproteobacteria bacterium]
PNESALISAPPEAFGFLGENPADMSVNGTLWMTPGKTLSLSAGGVTVDGGMLVAQSGKVDVAAVASQGEIPVETLDVSSFNRLGNIRVQGGAYLYTSNTRAGEIRIRGNRFELVGARAMSETFGAGGGGTVDIEVQDNLVITQGGIISAQNGGNGSGADIKLKAANLLVTNGGSIRTDVFSTGAGGKLTVDVDGTVLISDDGGTPAFISARGRSSGSGAAGAAQISADRALVQGDGRIMVETYGRGRGADLSFDVTSLDVTDGGTVIIGGSNIATRGGDLTIHASESVTISGGLAAGESGWAGEESARESGLYSYVPPSSDTEANTITINTRSLDISNGGGIRSLAMGEGRGTDIIIDAESSVTVAGHREGVSSTITSMTLGGGNAGDIRITTDTLTLADSASLAASSLGDGAAGGIDLDLSQLHIRDGGSVMSTAYASGEGGEITISASTGIDISGVCTSWPSIVLDKSFISAYSYGSGAAGNISIATPAMSITDGGFINTSTTGSGDAGDLYISIPRLSLDDEASIYASTSSDGLGGDIFVDTERLTITGGASIRSEVSATGDGGNLNVVATESVTISGISDNGTIQSRLSVETTGDGNAGDLFLSAPLVTVTDSGEINASSMDQGAGGDIRLAVTSLDMTQNGAISARSEGSGSAGSITIDAEYVIDLHNSIISTETLLADGGNITANAKTRLYLKGSAITTSVRDGQGSGGNIDIDPEFVVLNNSRIVANAYGGNGGNITISCDHFLASSNSVVDASSRLGIDGTVMIDSPETDLTSDLEVLNTPYLNVTPLLNDTCAISMAERVSSMLVKGRGGLPPAPGDLALSRKGDTTQAVDNDLGI